MAYRDQTRRQRDHGSSVCCPRDFASVALMILLLAFFTMYSTALALSIKYGHGDIRVNNRKKKVEILSEGIDMILNDVKDPNLKPVIKMDKQKTKEFEHDLMVPGRFYTGADKYLEMTVDIRTELMYSFSPSAFAKLFAGRYNPDRIKYSFSLLSPTVIELSRKPVKLLVIGQVKLTSQEVTANHISVNYLWKCVYQDKFKATDDCGMIGLPIPAGERDGPEDPKAFIHRGVVNVIFTMLSHRNDRGVYLFNLKTNALRKMRISTKNNLIKAKKVERNWIPLVSENHMYFIYTYDPLQVLDCTSTGECKFVKEFSGYNSPQFAFQYNLAGGSPFVRYKDSLYISVASSSVQNGCPQSGKITQTTHLHAHIVLLNMASSEFFIVFVSEPLKVKDSKETTGPGKPFVPSGIVLKDEDNVDVVGHVDGLESVIIRIDGIRAMAENVMMHIEEDEDYKISDPAVGSIHNYVIQAANNLCPPTN